MIVGIGVSCVRRIGAMYTENCTKNFSISRGNDCMGPDDLMEAQNE